MLALSWSEDVSAMLVIERLGFFVGLRVGRGEPKGTGVVKTDVHVAQRSMRMMHVRGFRPLQSSLLRSGEM